MATTTTTLAEQLRRIEVRKLALGLSSASEAAVDALRNKGGQRTPEKRELLRRAEARARQAGQDPVISYY